MSYTIEIINFQNSIKLNDNKYCLKDCQKNFKIVKESVENISKYEYVCAKFRQKTINITFIEVTVEIPW